MPPKLPNPAIGGNAATPQKQLHTPPTTFPELIDGAAGGGAEAGGGATAGGGGGEAAGGGGEAAGGGGEAAGGGGEAAGGGGEAAGGGGEAAGGGDATAATWLVTVEAAAVPFCAIAICKNFSCDLSAVGLIEKTMPLPQCPFCLQ